MNYIKTADLQKAYVSWSEMNPNMDPLDPKMDPLGFWSFVKIPNKQDSYNTQTGYWTLSPESASLVGILLSPHRDALLKVWEIRHGQSSQQ
jgi:hypothetical protein